MTNKTKGARHFFHKPCVIFFLIFSACATPSKNEVVTTTDAPRVPATEMVEVTRVSNYPEPIAIVSSTSQPRTLVIHLHGWVLGHPRDRGIHSIVKDMEFERILTENPGAMIIVPGSTGKNVTYDKQFVTAKNLQEVVESVLQQRSFSLDGFEHVVLTGHSGAYKTIGRILKTRNKTLLNEVVDRIALFDATYAVDPADYVKWIGREPLRRCLQVAYIKGSKTESNALALKRAVAGVTRGQPESCYLIMPSKSSDHWKTVPAHFAQFVFP